MMMDDFRLLTPAGSENSLGSDGTGLFRLDSAEEEDDQEVFNWDDTENIDIQVRETATAAKTTIARHGSQAESPSKDGADEKNEDSLTDDEDEDNIPRRKLKLSPRPEDGGKRTGKLQPGEASPIPREMSRTLSDATIRSESVCSESSASERTLRALSCRHMSDEIDFQDEEEHSPYAEERTKTNQGSTLSPQPNNNDEIKKTLSHHRQATQIGGGAPAMVEVNAPAATSGEKGKEQEQEQQEQDQRKVANTTPPPSTKGCCVVM